MDDTKRDELITRAKDRRFREATAASIGYCTPLYPKTADVRITAEGVTMIDVEGETYRYDPATDRLFFADW